MGAFGTRRLRSCTGPGIFLLLKETASEVAPRRRAVVQVTSLSPGEFVIEFVLDQPARQLPGNTAAGLADDPHLFLLLNGPAAVRVFDGRSPGATGIGGPWPNYVELTGLAELFSHLLNSQ